MKLSKAEKKFVVQLRRMLDEEEKRGNRVKIYTRVYNCFGLIIGEITLEK